MAAEHAEVVVVGSGFGGSVAAFRLAEAGRSVVLLERGRAYPPGSFPRTPAGTAANFWEPSQGRHGLFEVWSFDGIDGLVSSGLGGGSLVYANVLLRKDEKWFVREEGLPGGGYESWPISRQDLDPHYDAVETMMGATPYPYADPCKTEVMETAARALGLDLQRPPLAVSFSRRAGEPPVPLGEIPVPSYGNLHGVPRVTCNLCAECNFGCNLGAKNTLDHTYLSAARHHGADLRVRHEVTGFRPLDRGYEVTYVVHTAADGEVPRGLARRTITCDRLVLAAGTFGTGSLLLRNRTALPALSRTVGQRFSGNGDLLGLVLHAVQDGAPRPLGSNRGPVITTAVRVPDPADGTGSDRRGHYIEDAGYPAWAAWLVEAAHAAGTARRAFAFAADKIGERFGERDTTIGADLAALLGPAAFTTSSLALLGMGRDIPDGVLRLENGQLAVTWTTETSMAYFEGVRATMRAIAEEVGGEYHDNALWWANRVITVHPLGGAVMGRHAQEGVCDQYGEVFGHPGLYVLDGALLPGPVGANPSLTIAAVADRAATRMLETAVASTPTSGPAPATEEVRPAAPAAGPHASGVRFTERMRGFAALGTTDPQLGYEEGRRSDGALMFELTITVDDVDRFVADPVHEGTAAGYVEADFLGGRFDVQRGWFNLFSPGADAAERRMLYRLWLAGPGGNLLTFSGEKRVEDDRGLDVWRDTSTLYVRILQGHVPPGEPDTEVVASGIITIHVPDFLKQLTTFRCWGERPVHALDAFGRLFLGELYDVYGRLIARQEEHRP